MPKSSLTTQRVISSRKPTLVFTLAMLFLLGAAWLWLPALASGRAGVECKAVLQ